MISGQLGPPPRPSWSKTGIIAPAVDDCRSGVPATPVPTELQAYRDTAPNMPKVTVLIPFHNRAPYLREAIDSLLRQTFTDFELLAVDDGSTDGGAELVAAYSDPRVRLIRNEGNLGIAATRNRGVAAARGEYLAFLDSDDRALPRRLAHQAAFLDNHPDHAAVGAWIEWIDETGRRTGRIKRKPVSARQIAAERLFRSGIENSTAMARTEILRRYKHREDLELGSDYDLWARIAAEYKLAALPEVLVYRREHRKRVTTIETDTNKNRRLGIFAWQLRALGVDFTRQDLERHHLLRRMNKVKFAPDAAFLDWAEVWLLGLQSANHRADLYPEPQFSGVLGGLWLKTCWNARTKGGRRPWRRFWGSPLRAAAWTGIRQFADMRFAAMRARHENA